MAFTYRVIPLAGRWVGPRTARATRSPFKDRWTSTVRLLARETGGRYAPEALVADLEAARLAVRFALTFTHPDRASGAAERFHAVQQARAVLAAHHHTTF